VFNSPMLHVLRVEMVINSPWMLSKNWLVQKQTDFGQTEIGKESSNPFMAGSLPKTILYSFLHKICFHDEGIELVADQEKDAEVQKAVEIVTTAKLMTEVVTAAATQVVATSTPIPAAKPKILNITVAPAISTRRRKRVVIRDPEEELTSDTPAETPKVKDKGKGILIEAPKPINKKDQIEMDAVYARKRQEEINKEHEETYKNIDWNAALDHVQSKEPQLQDGFLEEMEKEDEEIIKSINETLAQKATKRRKLSEEAQEADDLRKRLEIVQDEDDDVFVEATPLAQKTMFEEPDGQDAIWRNQKSVHGLALVKR
nr:hypothetical protein [Tanacetum cinerariifolium]